MVTDLDKSEIKPGDLVICFNPIEGFTTRYKKYLVQGLRESENRIVITDDRDQEMWTNADRFRLDRNIRKNLKLVTEEKKLEKLMSIKDKLHPISHMVLSYFKQEPNYILGPHDRQFINDIYKEYFAREAAIRDTVDALKLFHGNLTEASKYLGIGRRTLYMRIKRYGIDVETIRKSHIVLSAEDFDNLVETLNNPPEPNEALRAAAKRFKELKND